METIRLLLVDDEEDFRTTLASRLRKRNIDVTDVGSGNEAIELTEKGSFDVAVVDIKMPGMDGIETLRQLKKIDPLVEVILLTGHGSIEAGIDGMRLGAYDYLMKPYNVKDLLQKIEDAYLRKQLEEERTQGK
ncbi:MAG: response regulator [Pseudomonadota bacterium]